MTKRQLSDGDPDGTSMGQGNSDKISFYGVTTIARQSLSTTSTLSSGSTLTQTSAAVTDMQTIMRNLGLIT